MIQSKNHIKVKKYFGLNEKKTYIIKICEIELKEKFIGLKAYIIRKG